MRLSIVRHALKTCSEFRAWGYVGRMVQEGLFVEVMVNSRLYSRLLRV